MADWAVTKVVKAPWNLVLKLGTNSGLSRNRAQVETASDWVKYPVTYEEWVWGTTCTNTQWGVDDTDTSDSVGATTLKKTTPTCTVVTPTGGATSDLVIPIAEDLTTTDYSTFKIKFTADITMPKNLIGSTVPLTAYIMDADNYQMIGKSTAVNILSVSKPTGQADT